MSWTLVCKWRERARVVFTDFKLVVTSGFRSLDTWLPPTFPGGIQTFSSQHTARHPLAHPATRIRWGSQGDAARFKYHPTLIWQLWGHLARTRLIIATHGPHLLIMSNMVIHRILHSIHTPYKQLCVSLQLGFHWQGRGRNVFYYAQGGQHSVMLNTCVGGLKMKMGKTMY